ncbi:hypothetical protein J120_02075 [candidate division TM6 bacterium JCVI TM6SC1]|uniref:Uncharacterized protein n=1 Tax=candidate division TM6 bacterium JCVI TM6SC1 TaxID=1306947 RepID=A0A0D2GQS3_9BACT|nr:hypothetical protein J120_02075 [candidate division TM6 bacterium JCVI TM6SC1]
MESLNMSVAIFVNNKISLAIPNSIFNALYHEYYNMLNNYSQYKQTLSEAMTRMDIATGSYFNIEESLPTYEVALAFYTIANMVHEKIEYNLRVLLASRPYYRQFYTIIEDRAQELAIAHGKAFIRISYKSF